MEEDITAEIDVFGQWRADISFKQGTKANLIKQTNELTGCLYGHDWEFSDDSLTELSSQRFISIIPKSTYPDPHPLHSACIYGKLSPVRHWIASGVPVDILDKDGWTPLMNAVYLGYLTLTKELIICGADVGHISIGGFTPLICACLQDHSTIADLLIKSGYTKPTQRDNHGKTALDYARENGMTYIVTLLKQLQ